MAKKYDPTKFETILAKVSPQRAAARYISRIKFGMTTGAYPATRSGQRPFADYVNFLVSPNSRIPSTDRVKLTNLSRFLCQSSFGTAITNRLTDNSIGNGLNFRASVDAEYLGLNSEQAKAKNNEFTRLWKTFWQAENGHYERMYNGGYFQAQAFKSMLEGGDSWAFPVSTKIRKNHRFPFAMQLKESEIVSTPTDKTGDTNFFDGVEKNASGIPVKVHFAAESKQVGLQENAYFSQSNWQARQIFGSNTGIRQIFQLRNIAQDRPGALRGIPFLTPTTGLIIDSQQLTESVLKAAKIQSIFAALWTGGTGGEKLATAPTGIQDTQTSTKLPRIDLTGGQIVDMPDGFDLKGFQSTQPGSNFDKFQMQILGLIGAITGIPRSFIIMIFEKSYSASRGEAAIFWTTVLRYRYAFVYQFLFPFWEYLLSWAVSTGNVSAPGFFDNPQTKAAYLGDPVHQYSGPRMPQLDLEKEAKGLVALRNGGFKSTRGIIEESFTENPDDVFDELDEEKQRGIIQAVATQTKALIDENENNEDDEGGEDED